MKNENLIIQLEDLLEENSEELLYFVRNKKISNLNKDFGTSFNYKYHRGFKSFYIELSFHNQVFMFQSDIDSNQRELYDDIEYELENLTTFAIEDVINFNYFDKIRYDYIDNITKQYLQDDKIEIHISDPRNRSFKVTKFEDIFKCIFDKKKTYEEICNENGLYCRSFILSKEESEKLESFISYYNKYISKLDCENILTISTNK